MRSNLWMEIRLIISWPWYGKMILDYPDGFSVITGDNKSKRGSQKGEKPRDGSMRPV